MKSGKPTWPSEEQRAQRDFEVEDRPQHRQRPARGGRGRAIDGGANRGGRKRVVALEERVKRRAQPVIGRPDERERSILLVSERARRPQREEPPR